MRKPNRNRGIIPGPAGAGRRTRLGIARMVFFAACAGSLSAGDGGAGIEDPFRIGADARALGLGNAAVAFPQDPSAPLWNPAGMVVVQQRGLLLSHTELFEDVQVQAVHYIHPTLSAGTFGLGVSRIGVGGIRRIEEVGGAAGTVPVDMGEFGYWQGKLTLGYGLTLFRGISIGTNFVTHRQVMGNASATGFGMDAGVHARIRWEGSPLHNVHLGASMSNVLPARLRLGGEYETLPATLRAGIAKTLFWRGGMDRFLVLADAEQGRNRETRIHAGAEYAIANALFLRAGFDDGEPTFGAGLSLRFFQIDYATGRLGDPAFFPRSHRFSLILFLGKSIPEQRRLIEVRRQAETRRRVEQEMEEALRKRVADALSAGKRHLASADYISARLEFGSVLRDDPGHAEAKRLLDETNRLETASQLAREDQLLQETRENEARQKDLAFVSQCFQEGLAFLDKGAYSKAISRWNQALERDPENEQIRSYISRTAGVQENEVQRRIGRARQLVREQKAAEAYQVLNQARETAGDSPRLNALVSEEMKNLDEKFGFLNAYQAGVEHFEKQDYAAAAEFLRRATELDPADQKARELFRNALARSQGAPREMRRDAKDRYAQGLRAYQDGDYAGALRIWEEALVIEPNNVKIIEAIQGARARLQTFQKNK
ncbi:PorV/PorQ family protein [bacterium]|nr:PorV/PorQ family protein [bacterium]